MASKIKSLSIALMFLAGGTTAASAESIVGDLDASYCEGEFSSQEFWYRRDPPLLGYGRGEALLAGGVGSCVVGFAKGPHIALNGRALSLVHRKARRSGEVLTSSDGNVRVYIRETGHDSSCVAGEDKCCGEYTYATVTVHSGGHKETIHVVRYEGG